MTETLLTKTQLREGVWEGIMASRQKPQVSVMHLDAPLDGVMIEAEGEGVWRVRVPVPITERLCRMGCRPS